MMELKDFLKDHPEQFDFKRLMFDYYEHYKRNHTGDAKYTELLEASKKIGEEKNGIKRWHYYRTLEKECYDQKEPKFYLFDCDSWNGTCDLTTEIYTVLWRDAPWPADMSKDRFGGDTMNSFAITFNALASERDTCSSYVQYENSPGKFDVLEEYAKRTGCIGNFVLVPKDYNRDRGLSKLLCDYWDLSLDNLRRNRDARDWLDGVDMTFYEYVNAFFLWDYVDNTYHVRPLFPSHETLLKPAHELVLPRKYEQTAIDEFSIFTNNVNTRILRRGLFMVAMLKIADNNKDEYKEIVKALATDSRLGSMENVVQLCQDRGRQSHFSHETLMTLSSLAERLKNVPIREEN